VSTESRRQRAVRRRRLEPTVDHIRAISELPVFQQPGSEDRDTPTPSYVDADAEERREPAEKNADDDESTRVGTHNHVDTTGTYSTGGERKASFRQSREIVGRKQTTEPWTSSSRSDSESVTTVQCLGHVPMQRPASSLSLRSAVSSDGLSLGSSGSTLKYDDEEGRLPPANLKIVMDGRSAAYSALQGRTSSDLTSRQRRSRSTSPPHDASLYKGDTSGRVDDEDFRRRKTTFGDTLQDIQGDNSDRNQTSAANTDIYFRITPQDSVVAQTQRVEERNEECVAAAVSGIAEESGCQKGSGPLGSDVSFQTSAAGRAGAVSAERSSRTSVVTARRRRAAHAKRAVDVLSGRSADRPPGEHLTADSDVLLAPSVLQQNGAKSSSDDEQQTPENSKPLT